ncbi:MAG: transporter substrate-binding domain-containing protein, partial [bacterium]|nr:transporter substrate-binding domain-containing protein [bacterium]
MAGDVMTEKKNIVDDGLMCNFFVHCFERNDMLRLEFTLRFSLTALFVIALILLVSSPFCAHSAERPIRVATMICPPFVMNDASELSGLSIFLWDHIAVELGLEYSIEEYGLNEMLESVAQGKADVGVSCLSITQEREKIVDFSHSFFETHLAIAVKQRGFLHVIEKVFYNKRLFVIVGVIIGLASLIGGILFLLEHKINTRLYSMKNRGGKLVEAFITGLLFVTSGPIRYYEFKTLSGRMLAAVLAVGSTLMIASITAFLASAFTLEHMHTEITELHDLTHVKVGVTKASVSSEYLLEKGIIFFNFNDIQEQLAALDNGSLDAV